MGTRDNGVSIGEGHARLTSDEFSEVGVNVDGTRQ